ncbi:MAG: L,D-transpeptidase family protein [Chryseolinea sp.]
MRRSILIVLLVIAAAVAGYYFYPESRLESSIIIDSLVVLKRERVMKAYHNGELLKTYKIAIGQNSIGDKEFEGDKRTPEGQYHINGRNSNSGYHKNLAISYPDTRDCADAKAKGVSPGGDVKIHGLRNGLGFIGKFHRLFNWTAGCIAVTNDEVDELYRSVSPNAAIVIMP